MGVWYCGRCIKWCNSRLLTLMSRGPAGGLTYTVLATLRRIAWRGGVVLLSITRKSQRLRGASSHPASPRLGGRRGGGVLSLLMVRPTTSDIYLLILGLYPFVPYVSAMLDRWLIHISLLPSPNTSTDYIWITKARNSIRLAGNLGGAGHRHRHAKGGCLLPLALYGSR